MERLPADTNWPETQYTLYSALLRGGQEGRRELSNNLMKVYRGSLLRFYVRVSKPGDESFPQLPVREHSTLDEHAEDVVHEYFSKRAESLIQKWRDYRSENLKGRARHLRVFIRQDFRFHCQEMLRADLRYHGRARDLQDYNFDLEDSFSREVRREFAQEELNALVRVAIEQTLETYDVEDRRDHRILAEKKILGEQKYKSFADELSCNLATARKRVVRFKERLQPILRDLILEQGGDLNEYMEELE